VIDHVTIRSSDQRASEAFYDLVLGTIGLGRRAADPYAEWGDFSIVQADGSVPPTRRLHVGFYVPGRDLVHAFWEAGTAAGHRDDGAPGLRPEYSDDYYGAFLLDPDGNSIEAVTHDGAATPGSIDHVWMRVADVAASRRFYELLTPFTGFELAHDRPERASFRGPAAGFSVVAGTPSEHVHLAFPAAEDAVVDAFHAALTAAGHPDNGAPGERSVYHEGYYGAFVLDPDGNNVELVNHNRSVLLP
jgi:catechol 2,3-dioxygenase-like lactoylglutathione lyase family enzyme